MKLLYLSLLSFVFISSCSLALSKENTLPEEKKPIVQESLAPLPMLSKDTTFPLFSGQGVIAVDLDSGVFLYEKNADSPFFPASTTKIATALVAMDFYSPEQILEVKRIKVKGQKMYLVSGEKISVENLLYGLLIFSANDAAEVLAQNYQGGRDNFIAEMNLKAKQIKLNDTHFTDPTGLGSEGHVSTARDMLRLATVAMQDPIFAKIVATKERLVKSSGGKIVHHLSNINELLRSVEGVLGVKTGWTESARENLITYIERDNRKILIALLGSQDRFGETKELIEWIFDNYQWQEIEFYSP